MPNPLHIPSPQTRSPKLRYEEKNIRIILDSWIILEVVFGGITEDSATRPGPLMGAEVDGAYRIRHAGAVVHVAAGSCGPPLPCDAMRPGVQSHGPGTHGGMLFI